MLPGTWRGRDVTVLNAYEGVGAVLTGAMTEADVDELAHHAMPTVGACPGQFTANTMAMVSEALGLAPLGSSMMPAVYEERLAIARRAGELVMRDPRARRPAAARARHPQEPGERQRRGRRDRRLDQRRRCTCRRSRMRPASASRSTTSPRCSTARR